MKVDIWSDVRCPFCYIGKRKFEMALEKFPGKERVEVVWHSFELDPGLTTRPGADATGHIAEIKGVTRAQAEEMHQHVTGVAKEVGLDFHFERSVVANSFSAHRLIQLAKSKGLAAEAEEALFKAHFTDGINIDDMQSLVLIGNTIGLDENRVKEMLDSGGFSSQVRQDEMQAQSIGIGGVPFFLFDNAYAVSGAQSPDIFLQALGHTWKELEKEGSAADSKGDHCDPDGNCN
jgi:predicted DsbA family dithiol-disulfide isomerase